MKNGVKAGDFIGVYAPNSLFFVQAYLAITTLGACAVLLPPQLDEMTVFGCTMKFGFKVFLYDGVLEEKVQLIKEKNKNVVLMDNSPKDGEPFAAVDVPKQAPSTVIFTGGTTGKSKGALLSNQAVIRGA